MTARVVVGVDGTEKDDVVLPWAAQIAKARDASLQVVHGWSDEPDFAEHYKERGEKIIDDALAKVRDLDSSVPIEVVREAEPASKLLERLSEGADVVVVGEGRHPHIHALLEGSVGHYTLTHARSPVLLAKLPHHSD